jgi:hypothetical protein
MTRRKAQCRGFDDEIKAARRELLPLTTGVVIHVKKERSRLLRQRVRGRNGSATKIQALARGMLVRMAYSDPYRAYWIECYDMEQSDKPYYFNTYSQDTVWRKPASFKYFGTCVPPPTDGDDDDDEESDTDSDV